MHKRSSALLPVLALCLVQLNTRANDIEPTKEFYTVPFASKPIVLDGDLSEWSGVPVLADPKFAVPKYSGTNASPNYVLFEEYDGGKWTGPDDQTSAVQIAYDADNVYFGFHGNRPSPQNRNRRYQHRRRFEPPTMLITSISVLW